MDSEAEGSLWISCAGGLSAVSHIPVQRVAAEGEKLEVKVSGLMGGHSGAEIDKNRANANKLMGRFLYGLKKKADYAVISLVRKTMPSQEKPYVKFLLPEKMSKQ